MLRRLPTSASAPLLALLLVSVLSFGARALFLDEPCASPCNTADDHTLIFDEAYYVQAARVIAGIQPPSSDHYADAPLGTDPNAEHPSGAKLIMAGAIELFGDGPFAWRIGSLLMGSLAILGMFVLVRSAGGGPWSALCASALMACDNLLLIHGRIGTLDIYVVAMMIWGVALYLRGRPLLAGLALAVAYAFKEVGVYALAVLALIEIGRLLVTWRSDEKPSGWRPLPALARFAIASITSMAAFVVLLAIMGEIATPYADADAKLITGGPFAEIAHIISYGASLTSPNGPQGIASYPWYWLLDLKPIVYLRIGPSIPGHEVGAIHPVSAFIGIVSPPIMVVAMPALLFCAYRFMRRRRASAGNGGSLADRQLAILAVAWFLGTWTPFAIQSVIWQRTSYLYYMTVVMPGLYVSATYAASLAWRRGSTWLRVVAVLWALAVAVSAVLLIPFVAAF